MERSCLGDEGRWLALGMKIKGPDRLGYDPSYERLDTYIAILQSWTCRGTGENNLNLSRLNFIESQTEIRSEAFSRPGALGASSDNVCGVFCLNTN
jgi:hypothetical protein